MQQCLSDLIGPSRHFFYSDSPGLAYSHTSTTVSELCLFLSRWCRQKRITRGLWFNGGASLDSRHLPFQTLSLSTHQQRNPVQIRGAKHSAESEDRNLFTPIDAGFCSCRRLLQLSQWLLIGSLINMNAIKEGKPTKHYYCWETQGSMVDWVIWLYSICDSRAGGGAGRHHRSVCPVNTPLLLPLQCRYAASWPGEDPCVSEPSVLGH